MKLARYCCSVAFLFFALLWSSCGSDAPEEQPAPTEPVPTTITVDPASVKQEMVGFGGALTWYSNWVTGSSNKAEMADLMFNDLGIDIIRFKNWYYPDDYPAVKSTDVMNDDFSKPHWDATNELFQLAKARNANVKTLLSSWGPPKSLKSNNNTREGTLKKENGAFVYDAFADYWVDVLDHVPFKPDYISIQNEPTYLNSGWTTCQWSILETASLPGYSVAFNNVFDKIKNRAHVPIMIGPESQDVNTFVSFANVLNDNPNCQVLAYHPYNINSGTAVGQVTSSLQSVGNFGGKLNFMTEFSDNLDWFNTALFIHRSLVYANTSAYIYWKLAWATPTSGEDAGMISVNSSGVYKTTAYYHLIKHFSRNIDAGYHRVETTSSKSSLNASAFLSPDGKKVTLVIINAGATNENIQTTVTGKTVSSLTIVQSKENSYYKAVTLAAPTELIPLPTKSVTTVVLEVQ